MTKKRKPNSSRPGGAQPQDDADNSTDYFEFFGGDVTRHGRFIEMSTHRTAERQAELEEHLRQLVPQLESELDVQMERLDELLQEAGPENCVAVASLSYLLKDANMYRESEDDRSPGHVEFLALRALPLLGTQPRADSRSIGIVGLEALELVRDAFEAATMLLNLRSFFAAVTAESTAVADFARHTRMSSLLVRGTAYAEHTKAIFDGCLVPYDETLQRILGFSATDAWALARGVGELVIGRFDPVLQQMAVDADENLRQIKLLRRKRQLPQYLRELTPTQQKTYAHFQAYLDAAASSRSISAFTADELADISGVSPAAAERWLDAFSCAPSEYVPRFHRHPVGGHPIVRLPILRLDDGYLVPSPGSLLEALRPRVEDLLSESSPEEWDRYSAHRGRWLEEVAVSRLSAALPGSVSWTGLEWSSPVDASDLDGLIRCDDLGLRIQAKGGRLSPAARRGAPSMTEDIGTLIGEAADQHQRLATALQANVPGALGFNSEQALALEAPLSLDVIVTLDDVTIWSTHTHRLTSIVSIGSETRYPWVLSIADLMATTDLLQGCELVHYLTRRQRIEHEGRLETNDELDWVGHYISEGLYFDDFFTGDSVPDGVGLPSYTEPIDAWYFSRAGQLRDPIDRPQQEMDPRLRRFLRRLESDRPDHWLTAGAMILNGDDVARENIVRTLVHTGQRSEAVGFSDGTVGFDTYGITFMASHDRSRDALLAQMQSYATYKMTQLGRPNWVSVGITESEGLVVDIREADANLRLSDVLCRRDQAPHGQRSEPPATGV